MRSFLGLLMFMGTMYGIWKDNTTIVIWVLIFCVGYLVGGFVEYLDPTEGAK